MTARMQDVAEQAGVSVATVSHVFKQGALRFAGHAQKGAESHPGDGVSQERPCPAVGAKAGSDFLGLVVSDIGNPFFPDIIKSFETAALQRGFDLLL